MTRPVGGANIINEESTSSPVGGGTEPKAGLPTATRLRETVCVYSLMRQAVCW